MQKDDLVYVGHMLDVAQSIAAKTEGRTREEYDADEILRLALTHLIQTIGEAATRVSQEFRENYPQIPWKNIIGMRHRVVHDYIHIDYDLVWEVVTHDIRPLIVELNEIAPPRP
jgi:uncharacterized protein with HEPN domain